MKSIIRLIFKRVLGVLFRVRVSGLEREIDTHKLLVIANHESFLDGLLLGLYLPFDPVFVVHTGIARNFWFKLVLSQVDYLTVDPTSPMAIKKIIRLVESGRHLAGETQPTAEGRRRRARIPLHSGPPGGPDLVRGAEAGRGDPGAGHRRPRHGCRRSARMRYR